MQARGEGSRGRPESSKREDRVPVWDPRRNMLASSSPPTRSPIDWDFPTSVRTAVSCAGDASRTARDDPRRCGPALHEPRRSACDYRREDREEGREGLARTFAGETCRAPNRSSQRVRNRAWKGSGAARMAAMASITIATGTWTATGTNVSLLVRNKTPPTRTAAMTARCLLCISSLAASDAPILVWSSPAARLSRRDPSARSRVSMAPDS
jgi:hypothetical protein